MATLRLLVGYTLCMVERSSSMDTWCPNCHRSVVEDDLRECVICRSLFCPNCVERGYGREFCSTRCRDYFFFGDMEEMGEEESGG